MKDKLIAHRGDMTTYPENSLLAFQSAVALGFKNIELDIQISKDCVPIVIHDENLERTAGVEQLVKNLYANEIIKIPLSVPIKYTDRAELLNIATLNQVVNILNEYPEITLFVEIKRQSVDYFNVNDVVESTMKALTDVNFKIVIISFLENVIEYARKNYKCPIGWVIKTLDSKSLEMAKIIQPNYIFCNINKINMDTLTLWNGAWELALYDIKDPKHAKKLLEQGISLIETGDIVKLSKAEYFR